MKEIETRLTIITPVFNGEAFIESCLETVIAQGRADVEHIIVDGASKDATVDIVRHYADRYSHIRWVSKRDRGQSDAMNKGISLARGPILGFLNVDDFYEPGVFNRALAILSELPEPSMVVGNCRVWSGDGRLLKVNRPRRLGLLDLLMGWQANPIPANPSAYFYHKSLHDRIGPYNVEEHFALDLLFVLNAVQGAIKTLHVDEVWGNFRFMPGTKTFGECREGRNWDRYNRILAAYEARLPAPRRLQLAARRLAWRCNHNCRKTLRKALRRMGIHPWAQRIS